MKCQKVFANLAAKLSIAKESSPPPHSPPPERVFVSLCCGERSNVIWEEGRRRGVVCWCSACVLSPFIMDSACNLAPRKTHVCKFMHLSRLNMCSHDYVTSSSDVRKCAKQSTFVRTLDANSIQSEGKMHQKIIQSQDRFLATSSRPEVIVLFALSL